jgi:hypothetical protein
MEEIKIENSLDWNMTTNMLVNMLEKLRGPNDYRYQNNYDLRLVTPYMEYYNKFMQIQQYALQIFTMEPLRKFNGSYKKGKRAAHERELKKLNVAVNKFYYNLLFAVMKY